MRRLCRWLLPAALAASAGAGLALWRHDAMPGAAPPGPAEPVLAPSPSGPGPLRRSAGSAADGQGRRFEASIVAGGAKRPRATSAAADSAGADSPDAVIPPAHRRLEGLAAELERLARHAPEEALSHLSSLDRESFRYLGEDTVQAAARQAPQRTLAWLEANVADDRVRQWLRAAALAGAAAHDPIFALNEAQSLHDGELRRTARHRVLETWAAGDPVAAFEWVRGHEGPDAADLHATVLQAYARRSPAEAGHLIASLPHGSIRNRLVEEHAWALASSDPVAAVDWILGLADEQAEAPALEAVIDQWARRDPSGLAGALDRLPEVHRESARARVTSQRAVSAARDAPHDAPPLD